MSRSTLEMRDKRAGLVAQARKIYDTAEEEKRAMSTEENTQWDTIMADAETLKDKIDKAEKLEREEKALAEPAGTKTKVEVAENGKPKHILASPEYRDAFAGWIHGGMAALPSEQIALVDKAYQAALQMDIDVSGGWLVTPQQMAEGILKAVDDIVHIEQFATKRMIPKAASLGVLSLDSDPDDGDWTAELDTGNLTDITLGKRELNPHPLAKRALISNKLLRAASEDAEALLRERIVYKLAVTREKAWLLGTGSNQPLGIMTPSADGIPTSRDVVAGSATVLSFDGLIDVKYALKSQYWPKSRWMFHRDAIKMLAKLKDGEGQYIWRENVRENEPDMLLSRPLIISEHMPNTYTSGKYAGFFGDLSFYWIADALDMLVQRLVELYALTNQTGFHFRTETDGMPVLAEAFVRAKMG